MSPTAFDLSSPEIHQSNKNYMSTSPSGHTYTSQFAFARLPSTSCFHVLARGFLSDVSSRPAPRANLQRLGLSCQRHSQTQPKIITNKNYKTKTLTACSHLNTILTRTTELLVICTHSGFRTCQHEAWFIVSLLFSALSHWCSDYCLAWFMLFAHRLNPAGSLILISNLPVCRFWPALVSTPVSSYSHLKKTQSTIHNGTSEQREDDPVQSKSKTQMYDGASVCACYLPYSLTVVFFIFSFLLYYMILMAHSVDVLHTAWCFSTSTGICPHILTMLTNTEEQQEAQMSYTSWRYGQSRWYLEKFWI